jgi:hypothetical protein
MIKKGVEKVLKYEEIKNGSNIINKGATGKISKSFRKYLNNIPEKHDIHFGH